MLSLVLAAAMQVGPTLPGDPRAVPALPPQPPRAAPAATAAPPPAGSTRLERCLSVVAGQPAEALSAGDAWLRQARGPERAEAQHCRGLALVELGRHAEARTAFLAGRDAAGDEPEYAARLGGLAGNAAVLAGDAAGALPLFEAARSAAQSAGEGELALGFQLDAAAAQAALGQGEQARGTLAAARQAAPADPEVLLMSAVLARGAGDLAEAQRWIEQAARAAPRDGRIALEAGIIAALDGRTDAAARSWRSVLEVAPGSPEASTARAYLQQIGAGDVPAAEPSSR